MDVSGTVKLRGWKVGLSLLNLDQGPMNRVGRDGTREGFNSCTVATGFGGNKTMIKGFQLKFTREAVYQKSFKACTRLHAPADSCRNEFSVGF